MDTAKTMAYYDRTDKSNSPRCAQCGNTSPEKGFAVKEVIHRGRDPFTRKACVDHTKFTVCNGTACGAHLQMGHEG